MPFRVCQTRCAECLFSRNKLVNEERKAAIVSQCVVDDTFFICHKFGISDGEGNLRGEAVCCRGFYKAHGDKINLIRIAQRLKQVVAVCVPEYPLWSVPGNGPGEKTPEANSGEEGSAADESGRAKVTVPPMHGDPASRSEGVLISRAESYAVQAQERTMRVLRAVLGDPRWYSIAVPDASERDLDRATLDAALARLRRQGLNMSPSYQRLLAKHSAIMAGFPYRRIRFDPSGLIGALGGEIATLNRNARWQRIPGRRKKSDVGYQR